jgi:predicted transcriptional regulator
MGIRRMNTTSPPPNAEARRKHALELRTRYDTGATVDELAESTGLSHGTIVNRLHAAGTAMRTPHETRQVRADEDHVVARRHLAASLRVRYESGATVDTLAADCGRSARTVRRLLIEAGTTLRAPHQTRQLHADENQVAGRQQLMATLRTRYEAGESVPALATDCGCSLSTVYRLLHKAGTAMRPQHQPSAPGRRTARPP